jgi:hypothetical protein
MWVSAVRSTNLGGKYINLAERKFKVDLESEYEGRSEERK